MKTKSILAVLVALAAATAQPTLQAGTASTGTATDTHPPAVENPAAAAALRVAVDPRIELLSLIFRLAGNSEYNQGRVDSYTEDAEKQFGSFREHAAVKLARELRETRGISFDACMGMAVHLDDAYGLKLKVPLAPWPESLDQRWDPASVSKFLAAARQFVQDTQFKEFITKHHSLYQTTETRMNRLMEEQAHLGWFNDYFGGRPQATFTVAPGLFNGGCCYGPHFRDTAGREELFCVLGVWQTDSEGLPEFTGEMLATIVHEFSHSYANPLIDRHLNELLQPGETLFKQVAERMKSQAYGNASTMLRETLVRGCVIRYVRKYEGTTAALRAVQNEKSRGFLWMQEFSDLLGEYEAHRDQYRTLEAFAPRFVAFFAYYARDFHAKQTSPGHGQ